MLTNAPGLVARGSGAHGARAAMLLPHLSATSFPQQKILQDEFSIA
jgi:hypothetical protein